MGLSRTRLLPPKGQMPQKEGQPLQLQGGRLPSRKRCTCHGEQSEKIIGAKPLKPEESQGEDR